MIKEIKNRSKSYLPIQYSCSIQNPLVLILEREGHQLFKRVNLIINKYHFGK